MKIVTDEEIFFLALRLSGIKAPDTLRTDRQMGLLSGACIGMVLVRDNLELEQAKEKGRKLKDEYYLRWSHGELKEEAAVAQ